LAFSQFLLRIQRNDIFACERIGSNKVSQRDLNWDLLACEVQVSFAYLARERKVAGNYEIVLIQAIRHIGFEHGLDLNHAPNVGP
jgi:hypothetical protein